jgi:hypothetical protein
MRVARIDSEFTLVLKGSQAPFFGREQVLQEFFDLLVS